MLPNNTKDLELQFEKTGALWKYKGEGPHAKTVLHNRHMDCYFNSNFICNKPKFVEELCSKYFIPYLSSNNIKPDWVITCLPYGLTFASELARGINAKFAYLDPLNPQNMEFGIMPNDRVLIVNDDIYGGGSIRKTISAVLEKEAIVEEIVICFANMTNSQKLDNKEIYSLIAPAVKSWTDKNDSPLPMDSKGLPAREKWLELINSEK